MNSYALVFLAVLPFCVGSAVPSQPKVRLCKGEEPNLSECWKSNFKEIVQSLNDGVPQNNIPPLLPLYVPDFFLKTATYVSKISHLNFDSSDYDIVDVICRPNDNAATLKILIRDLKFNCEAEVKGSILELDVSGVAKSSASYVNVTASIHLEWETFEVNGVKYHNVFGDYDNIDFGHLVLHSFGQVTDADKHQKLKDHYRNTGKQIAEYEQVLNKVEHSFLKHLLRYILRAYNTFKVADE